MGPPNARNNCHTTIRIRIAQAVTCMMSYALVTKGKYSSMAVISVPSASRKSPDTASKSCETILAIQPTIPSKIQSRMGITSFGSLDFTYGSLAGVVTALDQRLQVCHNKAQGIQDDPGDNDALQPVGCLIDCTLVTGNHTHQKCDCRNRDSNDGTDGYDLTIHILQDGGEACPDGTGAGRCCQDRLHRQHCGSGHAHCRPVGIVQPLLAFGELLDHVYYLLY